MRKQKDSEEERKRWFK